ncbi:MAG: hypothetical protein R3E97_12805 [Candidatus Eisenbacteria bacterium]
MNRRLLPALGLVGSLAFFGCAEKETESPMGPGGGILTTVDDPCGEVTSVRLLAGQTIDVGTVTVENDGVELCVTYQTSGDWLLYETHLDIRLELGDVPQTKSGNPKVGKFAHSHDLSGVTSDEYCFSLSELGYTSGMNLVVAAHGVVERVVDGQSVQEETAWGEGPEFPGNSWAMYLGHTVQECNEDPPFEEGDFTTHTQGEWGGECLDPSDPSCYLIDHWFDCLSDGESATLVIGCLELGGETITFNTPESLIDYLPIFGSSQALVDSYYDPQLIEDEEGSFWQGGEGGELVGQIVALQLNIAFDSCDPDFGVSEASFGELLVCAEDSPFFGSTVEAVLAEANSAIGGCGSVYTYEELTAALAAINETFVPGEPVGSYVCTGGGEPE